MPTKAKFHAWGLQMCTLLLCWHQARGDLGPHDNTAPLQLMTAAEMKQAVADIRMDARNRLQEIREQMDKLRVEADQLQELING